MCADAHFHLCQSKYAVRLVKLFRWMQSSVCSTSLVLSHFRMQLSLSLVSDSFPCLQQVWIISTTYFSGVEDFLPMGPLPSQIHSWTWKILTSNSKMLHTKGNLVNTARPGCEGCAHRMELDLCDYSGVVKWPYFLRVNGLSLPGDCTNFWCLQPHTPRM